MIRPGIMRQNQFSDFGCFARGVVVGAVLV